MGQALRRAQSAKLRAPLPTKLPAPLPPIPSSLLEERDPSFDAMLSQMVGSISSKTEPKKPLPKLRNTKPGDVGRQQQCSVIPGTLDAMQLREILKLREGKADDHDGPMGVDEIARRFRLDLLQVEKVLGFVSLPPEAGSGEQRRTG
ncbi:hypothetical protein Droror1_Dr00024515 [Drosera rotundifolia]